MSCDCDVTCLFIITKKKKKKEIQKKRNIKSRKIDKRKRKMLVSKVFHNIDVLDELADKPILPWPTFSKEEFRLVLVNCNNSSVPGPNKLSWSHLKIILKDDDCLNLIVNIANACIEVGY